MSTDAERPENGRETIARLAEETVPMLIERLSRSDLGELEVRENGWRIRLRRPVGPVNGNSIEQGRAQANPSPAASGRPIEPVERHQPTRPDTARGSVTSPAVGYFAPRDGISVGSKLRGGDTIGHVDVLGVRQEVVSPLDGTLRGLDVEAGQAVEYGQPIGRVEPDV